MIGLILIYFLGKEFYELANLNNKNGWLYAVLGVVSYYGGTFIGGVLMTIALLLINGELVEGVESSWGLTLFSIPFGLLLTWGLYTYLKKRFENESNPDLNSDSDILDDGFLDEE